MKRVFRWIFVAAAAFLCAWSAVQGLTLLLVYQDPSRGIPWCLCAVLFALAYFLICNSTSMAEWIKKRFSHGEDEGLDPWDLDK